MIKNKNLLDVFRSDANVIKVCDFPNLKIRKFSQSNDIDAVNTLRRYARLGRNDLTDFSCASSYLSRGNLYLLVFNKTIYFFCPRTLQVESNKGYNKVSPGVKNWIIDIINNQHRLEEELEVPNED